MGTMDNQEKLVYPTPPRPGGRVVNSSTGELEPFFKFIRPGETIAGVLTGEKVINGQTCYLLNAETARAPYAGRTVVLPTHVQLMSFLEDVLAGHRVWIAYVG